MVKSIGYGTYGYGAEATTAVETAAAPPASPAPVAPKAAPKKLIGRSFTYLTDCCLGLLEVTGSNEIN